MANISTTSLAHSGNVSYNVDAVSYNVGAAYGGPRFGHSFNTQQGAQLGIANRPVAMDGGTPLPLNCALVFVLQMPRMWDRFPVTQQQYKSMIEMNASSIDGIDLNYQMEFGDVENGHDGQMASMPLMTKRSPVTPSVTLNDTGGNMFWNMNYMWMKHMAHPDTCASLLSALYGDAMEAWVWSTFSMTWLVVQPDPSGLPNRIVDAAVITNMIPQETGNLGMKRAIGQAEIAKRTVSYKGVITHSESTRELGRLTMQATQIHKPNLDLALTYDGVRANINYMGHQAWMRQAAADGLTSGTNLVAAANSTLNGNGVLAEALNDYGITSDSASGL